MAKTDAATTRRINRKLSEVLIEEMKKRAPFDLVEKYPGLVEAMANGEKAFTLGEVIVHKLLVLAADTKSNKWAVEMVFDRLEGKPVAGEQKSDKGRRIEERLDAITVEHLNEILPSSVGPDTAPKESPEPEPEEEAEEAVEAEAAAEPEDPNDVTENPLSRKLRGDGS